ncbi:MAG: tail fiber protein [Flavobacterium sp.]
MAVVTPTAKAQFIDAAGIPLAGGFLYTYEAGTTTPQATYVDAAASTANSNPIILDSRGEANIWLSSANYKFKLTDANGTEIWTVDNIAAPSTALSPVFTSNVTISANTSGPALLVTQTGAGAAIRVQDSADPDATPFVVDTSGNVGIGTPTPANALDIAGGTLQISSAGGTARSTISADASNSYFAASDDRNLTLQTNSATRLTVNSSSATSTVPVVLPANPTTSLQAATKGYVDLGSPAGIIAPFAGTSAPSGWLACNGAAVSRVDYATLFAAIGTTWGAGDGSVTFNVPDLRGTFLRGTGTNGTYGTAVGQAVGTYAADTYLNHNHGISDPSHSHSVSSFASPGLSPGGTTYSTVSGTTSTGASTTGISVNTSTTGGTETKPKNYGVLYIIKT